MVNKKLSPAFQLIRDWAEERGIYEKGDVMTQFVKLSEEQGELAVGLLKNDDKLVYDAAGDMLVVLINLIHLYAIKNGCIGEMEHAFMIAWDEIKDRKGSMKDGTFVKES